MTTTTRGGVPPAVRKPPPPIERQERLEGLLAQTGRLVVPIRKTFVQQGHGRETKPGPLHKFLTSHDDRGLEAYLLVHAMASAHPWNCRLPSAAWVSALGLADTAAMDSAKAAVSKIMRRLESRKLLIRERSKRLSDVFLLKEDGSGEAFERPMGKGKDDRWLQLPYAYWLEEHYKKLSLPAKVMLLIALSLDDGFQMPYHWGPKYYGVSFDSTEEGLRELRKVGLLAEEHNWVKAPRSATGWTDQMTYTLLGSFSKAERTKASRVRHRAAEEVEEIEVGSGLLAPVVPMRAPTLADFFSQPSAEEELMSDAGPA